MADAAGVIFNTGTPAPFFEMVEPGEIVSELIPELKGCPKPVIEKNITRAVKDFCRVSGVFQLTFNADVTGLNESPEASAAFDLSEYLTDSEISAVGTVQSQFWKDIPIKITSLAMSDKDLMSGFYYQVFGENKTQFRIFPLAGDNCKLRITVYFNPVSTTVPESIIDEYRDAIIYKAKSQLFEQFGKPWSNPEAAFYYKSMYSSELGQIVINSSNRFNKERKSVRII